MRVCGRCRGHTGYAPSYLHHSVRDAYRCLSSLSTLADVGGVCYLQCQCLLGCAAWTGWILLCLTYPHPGCHWVLPFTPDDQSSHLLNTFMSNAVYACCGECLQVFEPFIPYARRLYWLSIQLSILCESVTIVACFPCCFASPVMPLQLLVSPLSCLKLP